MPSDRTYGDLFGVDEQLYGNYGDPIPPIPPILNPPQPETVPASGAWEPPTYVWLEETHLLGGPVYQGLARYTIKIVLTSRRDLQPAATALPAPMPDRWNDEQDLADILRLLGIGPQ